MAVSEWHGGARIETGTVHPENAVVLSRLAYIATSDFPLGRSSVRERPEEKPRASTEAPRVARRLRARRCLRFYILHTPFSYNSRLSSLLSVTLLSSFNISENAS